MIQGHGGNRGEAARKARCRPEEIIDMSSNINPLGMVPGLLAFLQAQLSSIMSLPEVDARSATESLADILGISSAGMLMGTGTTQFIYTVCPALRPKKVLIVGPTYADYSSSCVMYGIEPDYFLARDAERFRIDCGALAQRAAQVDVVFICNPNNPTGILIPHEQLLELCRSQPATTFVIDESYLLFAQEGDDKSMVGSGLDNVVVLWSLSKIFGIPGLRAGFLVAEPEMARQFSQYMQPWCANTMAQEAMGFLADHQETLALFLQETKVYLQQEVALFRQRLGSSPVTLYPGVTPYQLIKLPPGKRSAAVCDQLVADRLLIRDCSNFVGLDERYIRISLKNREINQLVAEKLTAVLGEL
ncbi:MAG: histidinol phosphate aminotransferase [Desulfobulbus propionicus]|nr:MAG: histidinol phosphate aminotransferase [Desulfobulbus propionicus]